MSQTVLDEKCNLILDFYFSRHVISIFSKKTFHFYSFSSI